MEIAVIYYFDCMEIKLSIPELVADKVTPLVNLVPIAGKISILGPSFGNRVYQ